MNYGLVGTDTPIDDLLEQYFPGAPRNLLYEAFESEQSALLAAMLMELRGEDVDQDVTGDAEAVYYAENGVVVNTTTEDKVEWDFTADAVTIFGFDQPITVAFKDTNKDNREIHLSPSNAPFSVSPPGGLKTSTMWYSKQDTADEDTSLNLLAFR